MSQYKLISKSHLTVNFKQDGKNVSVIMSHGIVKELPDNDFVQRMVDRKILERVGEPARAKKSRAPKADKPAANETINPQPE
jgi:hypothetical protein